LQHRREQQINALVLWHASRLEQADSELYPRSVVVDGHGSKPARPRPRRALCAGRRFTGFEETPEHAVRTRCQY
jgi:hypothetical protein